MTTVTIVAAANRLRAAWVCLIESCGGVQKLSDCLLGNTQHEAILKGTLVALAECPLTEPVRVRSNSTYLIYGMRKHLAAWTERGWQTSDKQPVKHKLLWRKTATASRSFDKVSWTWIGNGKAAQLEMLRLAAANLINAQHQRRTRR